ncbi:hypothetical protein FE391_10180 [Nonomuraea sp. KC401]|nr:hypothetical protein FE391_10180 [Nonomuraea sp. KC401]
MRAAPAARRRPHRARLLRRPGPWTARRRTTAPRARKAPARAAPPRRTRGPPRPVRGRRGDAAAPSIGPAPRRLLFRVNPAVRE